MEIDLLTKRKEVELLKRKVELAKTFGLLGYKPHKKQVLFHAAAHFKFRLARCGNRFGKSDMGVSEDLAFALGERPWISKDNPLRYHGIPQRPTKGLVLCADDDKIDEIFTGNGSKGHVGKIWRKIPKTVVIGTPKKSSSGTIISLRIKGLYGESVIDFDTRSSFKNNPMGSESGDYDWIHVDEPIEEAHWKAVSRGLMDRGGKAWFTCTLIEQPWINDMFYEGPDNSKKEFHEVLNGERHLKWCMTGSVYDNPYLNKDDIEDYLNTLTEDERQCRIHGIPMHLSGLIYKQFDRAVHVYSDVPFGWKSMSEPPLDYTIHYAIDPHPRTPSAVLFCAVSPSGNAYFFDEIFKATTTDDLTKMIVDRLRGRHVWNQMVDPMAFIVDERNQTCMASDFAKFGLPLLIKAPKDLKRGIPEVQRLLKIPGLINVSAMCRTFLWEIGRYRWGDTHGVPTNKPIDKDDHMMENLYRLCLRGLDFFERDRMFAPIEDMVIDGNLGGLDSSLDLSRI